MISVESKVDENLHLTDVTITRYVSSSRARTSLAISNRSSLACMVFDSMPDRS